MLNWQFYVIIIFVLLVLFVAILAYQVKQVATEVPASVKAAAEETELSRDLKLWDITLLGVGAMIGAGIFVLTGIAAGIAGPGLLLAFLLNGFFAGLTALIYAELGSAVPEAGGGYLWVKSSMGQFQAFQSGWMSWLAHIVAGSLYGLGFGAYFALLLGEFGLINYDPHDPTYFFSIPTGFSDPIGFGYDKLLGVIVIIVFLFINFLGSSETGAVGNIITIIKIFVIGVFIISGLFVAFKSPLVNFEKLEPIFPTSLIDTDLPAAFQNSFVPVIIAMGFTFIAFEGYEIIVQTGEEVENPNINIPKAIFYALMIVVPIYVLVGLVSLVAITPATGETTWQFLSGVGELGIAEAARQFMPLGVALMLFGGLVSTLSALNATTYSSARVAFVMGRDDLLPKSFHSVNKWRRTPHVAIIVSGIIMIFVAVFLPIHDVASAADLLFIILFIQVNYAVKGIREKYGDRLFYGYKVPGVLIILTLAIITKVILGIALVWHSFVAFWGALIWLVAGTVIYYTFIKPRLKHDIRDAFEDYLLPEEDQ